jgi:hypothetical protein
MAVINKVVQSAVSLTIRRGIKIGLAWPGWEGHAQSSSILNFVQDHFGQVKMEENQL